MNQFPLEIVHHIFEYTGKIKYRNGKYMNQISNNDKRYDMLQKLSLKTFDKRIFDNGELIYKTRVNLTKFTLILLENDPLWYKKMCLVYKCKNSGLYTNMFWLT